MRSEIIQGKGCVSKTVTFDAKHCHGLKWIQDIRTMELDGHMTELEAPSAPIVALGRSLVHHLRSCGILDGFNSDRAIQGVVSYVFKLELRLDYQGAPYVVRLELSYRYRNPSVTRVDMLNYQEMVEFLYQKLMGEQALSRIEMRMHFLLVLLRVICDINGLQVPL